MGSSVLLACVTLIFFIVHAGQALEFSQANIHPSVIYSAYPFRVNPSRLRAKGHGAHGHVHELLQGYMPTMSY